MKHLFIINPKAGKGKALRLIPAIERFFGSDSLCKEEHCIEITRYPGEATEIVRRYIALGNLRVYSVGGDGTLNEVVNGLAGSGSSLAIIPAGSGNDFTRTLQYDLPIHALLLGTVNGGTKPVDLACVNGRYFINIASVGFDAEVVYHTQKTKEIPLMPPHLSYFAGIAATLCRYHNLQLEVTLDGHEINAKCLLMAIANGKYYGGGILPTPEAEIDDGWLDVCMIAEKNPLQIVTTMSKFIKGRHRQVPGVNFYKAREIRVASSYEIHLNFDGEIVPAKEAFFKVFPKGINLVIPGAPGFISRAQAAAAGQNF